MSTKEQLLILDSVIFESNDSKVNISGTIIQGHMSYETKLEINNTQLNYLISQMQKQNEDADIYALITSTKMSDGDLLYSGNFCQLDSRTVDLSNLEDLESIREIRA